MSDDDNSERLVKRSRRAAAALRAVSRVLHVVRMMMTADADVNGLLDTREGLEKKFAELTLLEPGQHEFLALLARLEAEVALLEQRLMKVDTAMPMGWFRRHFDSSKYSSEALADYAALVGRYAGDDPARLDRAQLLLTRLMFTFLGGSPSAFKAETMSTLLVEALPASQLDPTTRQAATEFFRAAAERINTFASLRQLTESSFFLDVRGYKLSLRQAVLDPEVMAGAIALNQSVNEGVNRLARRDVVEGGSMDEYMKVVDDRIREVFKALRTDDQQEVVEFEARLKAKQVPTGASGLITFDVNFQKRAIYRWLTLILLAGGSFLLWSQLQNVKPLTLISLEATETISPYLVTATVVPPPPKPPKLMIGRINKGKWAVLTAAQRAEVAQTLVETMKARGMMAATVMLEDQVVIQIERETVLLVQ